MFSETLESFGALEEDDESEPYAELANYDTTAFEDSETESLDPNMVLPFTSFFLSFLRHYYSTKIENLDFTSRYSQEWENNYDMMNMRNEATSSWRSFVSIFDDFELKYRDFNEKLVEWRKKVDLNIPPDDV